MHRAGCERRPRQDGASRFVPFAGLTTLIARLIQRCLAAPAARSTKCRALIMGCAPGHQRGGTSSVAVEWCGDDSAVGTAQRWQVSQIKSRFGGEAPWRSYSAARHCPSRKEPGSTADHLDADAFRCARFQVPDFSEGVVAVRGRGERGTSTLRNTPSAMSAVLCPPLPTPTFTVTPRLK